MLLLSSRTESCSEEGSDLAKNSPAEQRQRGEYRTAQSHDGESPSVERRNSQTITHRKTKCRHTTVFFNFSSLLCSLKKLPLPTGSHHSSCSGWARGKGASLPQAWLESHTSPSINCLLPWHHSSQKSYTNNRGSLSQNEECSALELKMPLAHKK